MKLFLNLFGRTVALLMMLAVLLSVLSIDIFAVSPLSVSKWTYFLYSSETLSAGSRSVSSITPGNSFLTSQVSSGDSFIYIGFTFSDDVSIPDGSQIYYAFELTSNGASPAYVYESDYQRVYYGSSLGSTFNYNTYSDSANIKAVEVSSTHIIFSASFTYHSGNDSYYIACLLHLPNSGMVLTTLIDPRVAGQTYDDAMLSAVSDLADKVSQNTISQQQGNAIAQSIADQISADYVDHDAVDDVVNNVSDHQLAEQEMQNQAIDLIETPVEINGETFTLSADADIMDVYSSAFSDILTNWQGFSLAGSTVFRSSLIHVISLFGIYLIFPLTIGLLGALIGRS